MTKSFPVVLAVFSIYLAGCGSGNDDDVTVDSQSSTVTTQNQTTLTSLAEEVEVESIQNEILGNSFTASDFGIEQSCLDDALSDSLGADGIDDLADRLNTESLSSETEEQLEQARTAVTDCLDDGVVVESLIELSGGEEARPFVECLLEEAGDVVTLLSQAADSESFRASVSSGFCSNLESNSADE